MFLIGIVEHETPGVQDWIHQQEAVEDLPNYVVAWEDLGDRAARNVVENGLMQPSPSHIVFFGVSIPLTRSENLITSAVAQRARAARSGSASTSSAHFATSAPQPGGNHVRGDYRGPPFDPDGFARFGRGVDC